ncbi:MAG: riboflavin synthase [Gemmatimonadaceae bacterium]
MFTGLVDDVGTIERVASTDAGRELRVRCRYDDVQDGESIALNGVCLTVREHGAGFFTCAAVSTTLALTTIGDWAIGRRVNLERALRPTDRLGGHFVLGHVDGVAQVTHTEVEGDALLVDLALPPDLSELMVERGSVAVDGVSLTIHAVPGPEVVQVSIVDFTRRHTTLGVLRAGDAVHVEADVIAKHVRRLLTFKS